MVAVEHHAAPTSGPGINDVQDDAREGLIAPAIANRLGIVSQNNRDLSLTATR